MEQKSSKMNKTRSKAAFFSVFCFAVILLFNLRIPDADTKGNIPVDQLRVLVLTGGHDYDTLDFRNLFDRMPMQVEHVELTKIATFFNSITDWNYDVIVFYNFRNRLGNRGKKNFLKLCEQGVGLVFLHHSLMGFDDWPAFKDIVGARYYFEGEVPKEKEGTYRHDVTMNITIQETDHPITQNLDDFRLYDEVYGNYWMSEENNVLLTTDHPESRTEIGWTRTYDQSRVVFLQPGHGKEALRDERYVTLVRRAILWAGNQL